MLSIKRPSLPVWKVPAVRSVRRLMNRNYCGEAAVGVKEENGMTSGPMFWVLYIVLLGYVIFHGNPSSEEGRSRDRRNC